MYKRQAEALAPEQSVDEVRESLSVTEKGQPANTIGNCRTVFCHDPLLRGAIRLNLLTDVYKRQRLLYSHKVVVDKMTTPTSLE